MLVADFVKKKRKEFILLFLAYLHTGQDSVEVGVLPTLAHSVSGVSYVDNAVTFRVENFTYDGQGPGITLYYIIKFLKLTTMYNIINGTLYFPTGYFVQNYFPYSSSHGILNYIRPFAGTNYLYLSFVPSVISLWNNLPDSVKTSSPISVFKAHIPH